MSFCDKVRNWCCGTSVAAAHIKADEAVDEAPERIVVEQPAGRPQAVSLPAMPPVPLPRPASPTEGAVAGVTARTTGSPSSHLHNSVFPVPSGPASVTHSVASSGGRVFAFRSARTSLTPREVEEIRNDFWRMPEEIRLIVAEWLGNALWVEIIGQNHDIDANSFDWDVRKLVILTSRFIKEIKIAFPIEGWQLRQIACYVSDIKIALVAAKNSPIPAAAASAGLTINTASAGAAVLAPIRRGARASLSPLVSPNTSPTPALIVADTSRAPVLPITPRIPEEPRFEFMSDMPARCREIIAEYAVEHLFLFENEACQAVVHGQQEVDAYHRLYRKALIVHGKTITTSKVVISSALKVFTCCANSLRDEDLVDLKLFQSITHLNITHASLLTPKIVATLALLPNLEVVTLTGTQNFTELFHTRWTEQAEVAFVELQKLDKFQSISCDGKVWRPASTANTLNPDRRTSRQPVMHITMSAATALGIWSREPSVNSMVRPGPLAITIPGAVAAGGRNSSHSSVTASHSKQSVSGSVRSTPKGSSIDPAN